MFRTILALLCITSAVQAERIQIVGTYATYSTADDFVNFEVWLDQQFDMAIHQVRIAGGDERAITASEDGVKFQIGNHSFDNQARIPLDVFNLRTIDLVNGGGINDVVTLDLDYSAGFGVRDSILCYVVSLTVPADLLRFDDYTPDANNEDRFFYSASVRDGLGLADVFMSYSTVDSPGYEELHTPEPSSIMLAAALVWLPRLRHGFRKRRFDIEPNRVRGHAEVA